MFAEVAYTGLLQQPPWEGREIIALITNWEIAGYVLCAVGVVYQGLVLCTLWRWRVRPEDPPAGRAPVTVLKPLAGHEPHLYECLRSFCDQDHPCFQIVFGVCDAGDPALGVVHRLKEEFPDLDIAVVVEPARHGQNRKVANLLNMLPRARHDRLVIADSDIRVERDYLLRVTAPLDDAQTGVVTCLYTGAPQAGLWSRLGALFINDWFLPSVLLSHAFGSRAFAFGATLALRREVLEAAGGLAALADELADDYRLGERSRQAGFRTVLSSCRVETRVHEPGPGSLWRHELRWARTIRALQPLGYAFSFLTYSVPLAFAGWLLSGRATPALALLAITVFLRLVLHYGVTGDSMKRVLSNSILIAMRDFLTFLVWFASFFGRTVWWQGRRLSVHRDGSVHRIH